MKLKKTSTDKVIEEPQQKKYNNLREVMDRNRPYCMLFSGVEDDKNFNILYDMGIRNFLISFHYAQKKRLDTSKYENLGIKFFVDSGAFTFMSSLEHRDWTIEQWENQICSYLKWVERHKSIIFAIANLDIEYLVGGEKVQEWNEKYFEPFMLRTGIPVCFVHHDEATLLTWEQYCQRYPYTGISWGGIDNQSSLQYGVEHLKVAEKHNSLVHGMAMTNTSLLTKLPFYTTDSTTWLVGLQYGEVNYWNNNKMSRLKKDKWKGSMLPNFVSMGFNEQKLLDEDPEEMIKVNIHAFIEAEKFVQDKLKSRMYWLRPDKIERTEADLANIKYPSTDWLENNVNQPDWGDYAKAFNITTESKDLALNNIIDMTCFMNWDNPEYKDFIERIYTPELINEIHTQWVNRIVETEEEKIEDLKQFFKDCLLGTNDKLLVLGTNFDRIVKERDNYITDEEYDYVDVPEEDVNFAMGKYLPSGAPEIDELDDEIFREEGIIPVRDEQGRFIKGQRKVARPKKLYSEKYPKLACDMCINAQKCPEYKAGYACAYNKMFDRYNTRDMGDIIQAMQGIAQYSMVRLQRSMVTETMNGGIPDPMVSQLMNQSTQLLGQLQRMYEVGSQEVIRQTKVTRADGTEETTTSISNPQSTGILAKIFGGSNEEEQPKEENMKDVTEVEENKQE